MFHNSNGIFILLHKFSLAVFVINTNKEGIGSVHFSQKMNNLRQNYDVCTVILKQRFFILTYSLLQCYNKTNV